jgi:hypothetical protein
MSGGCRSLFELSPKASYITGEVLSINGGLYSRIEIVLLLVKSFLGRRKVTPSLIELYLFMTFTILKVIFLHD